MPARVTAAEGDITRPRANVRQLVVWSVAELAPWVLAAFVLALLIPLLLAAERGEPFERTAARRLTRAGILLLVGIPAAAVVQFVAAEAVSVGDAVAPEAVPVLTLTVLQVLPGLIVLVLAEIFRRGAALRDLERHTI